MTSAEAAMAVVSFDQQMKHARELVSEGKKLLNVAHRDLDAGHVLVKRSRQRLTDTEAFFSRKPGARSAN